MKNLHAYLNYGGNCAEAFHFYEKYLGGKIEFMMTHGETPGVKELPPGIEKTDVLHGRITIAGTTLMASDVPRSRFEPMRSVYLCLGFDSSEEAERIHALLAEDGEVFMPMQETFYAFRFSMLRDRFGTSWMVIHERTMPNA